MADERLYIVAYDVACQKRWRRIFKTMKGYGRWLQLSLFQCRLTARRKAELATKLDALVKPGHDHVVIIDIGPADKADLRVESFGKKVETVRREAVIV
ncbi:MAG: CRISPR-associated endonuclease Cas2 [Pseudomonadota bacterium]